MKTNALDASKIDWQREPKPAQVPGSKGRHFYGYVVIFNTRDHSQPKTRGVLIRDGVVVGNSGF